MCQIVREVNNLRNPNPDLKTMRMLDTYLFRPDEGREGWIQNNSDRTMLFACKHTATGESDEHLVKPGEFLSFKDEVELTILPEMLKRRDNNGTNN